MNLDYLKTFLEVVRLGSFSDVAKKLNITQPAVTFQIHRLEGDIGVRLIDRSQKKISLTEAGKRLLRFAEHIEIENKELINDIEQLRDEITGDLSIAASTIPGEYLLLPLLSKFKERYPSIGINVMISDSVTVISSVRNGTYEIGFCGVNPEDRGIESFTMGNDEIVLIVPPEHPFVHKKKVSFIDLEGEALIFREESSGTRKSLELLFNKAGFDINRYQPKLILSTPQSVISAVEAGIGIAFVSNLGIKNSFALGLLKTIPVEGLKMERYFYCIYRQERVVSRLLNEFVSFIKTEIASNI